MRYTQLGRTGLNISKMTLGTWVMGGGEWWGADHDDKRYIDTIHKAIDNGINLIDTATRYGNGHSEEVVGQAVKGRRADVILSSKAYSEHLLAENAESSVRASMKRLQTDYIDIYYIHWPKPGIRIADSMEALEMLRQKGMIRFIGVSNVAMKHLELAGQAGTINVIQPPYSLLWRKIEGELLPHCTKNGIGTMTYAALGMGLLTGKYKLDTVFAEKDIRPERVAFFQKEIYPQALEAVDKVRAIARVYGATPAQAAIHWVMNRPGVDTAIIGARTPQQLAENLEAAQRDIPQNALDDMTQACSAVHAAVAGWDAMYGKHVPAMHDITE